MSAMMAFSWINQSMFWGVFASKTLMALHHGPVHAKKQQLLANPVRNLRYEIYNRAVIFVQYLQYSIHSSFCRFQ